MAKNEKTSRRVARLAGKALAGKPISKKDLKSIEGSDLTQAGDKKKKRR